MDLLTMIVAPQLAAGAHEATAESVRLGVVPHLTTTMEEDMGDALHHLAIMARRPQEDMKRTHTSEDRRHHQSEEEEATETHTHEVTHTDDPEALLRAMAMLAATDTRTADTRMIAIVRWSSARYQTQTGPLVTSLSARAIPVM